MEPYSAWADWLNKFHTASEGIQALWIVAGAVTVLGVTWVVMRGVVEVVRVWRVRRVLDLDCIGDLTPRRMQQSRPWHLLNYTGYRSARFRSR
jgi:hypothetical protein